MPEVRCSVSSCYYWADGNYCAADIIWIRNDAEVEQETAGDRADLEAAAPMGMTTAQVSPADKAIETCCQTFRHKGNQPRKVEQKR